LTKFSKPVKGDTTVRVTFCEKLSEEWLNGNCLRVLEEMRKAQDALVSIGGTNSAVMPTRTS
jgi:hypothetical protein